LHFTGRQLGSRQPSATSGVTQTFFQLGSTSVEHWSPAISGWVPTVYDFRIDPVMASGLPSHAAWFHDLSLRPIAASAPTPSATPAPTPSVTVTPTNGVYGAMVTTSTGQSVYEQYGPYTDPALYAIPAGQKLLMSVASTETIGTDKTQVSA
jgi:hypothetical protein